MMTVLTAVSLVPALVAPRPAVAAPAEAPRPPAFVAAPDSPIATGPMAGRPVIADFNSDGRPDIVLACGTCCGSRPKPDSGHVLILVNDGGGRFSRGPGDRVIVGPSARKVAVADFNRDGRLDVATAEHDNYGVRVFLGDGRAGLTPASGSPFAAHSGGRPHTHEIAAADVNGDRHPDLLTTNANDNSVSVLLGNGRGGFAPAPGSPFPAMRHPYDALAIRDVNGDGKLDVAAPLLRDGCLGVYHGDGAGGFKLGRGAPYLVGERPGYVVLEDLNGDGRPDLLATHDDVGMLDVLLNNGKGGFQPVPGSPFRTARATWGITTADFNGDGSTDVLLGGQNEPKLTLLLGDGRGGVVEATGVDLPAGQLPNYVAAADLNADGRIDLVASNYGSGDVTVLLAK